MDARERSIAEAVRAACLRAAIDAYEDGGLRGLCAEGRWEYALEAIRAIDLETSSLPEGSVDDSRSRHPARSSRADVTTYD